MCFKKIKFYFFGFGIFLLCFFSFIKFSEAASLNGRILLQVQDKGQAWYVNPLDNKRYYLGRPDDAFNVIRSFGLGVSNNDLAAFIKNGAPSRLSGRILLQVQDKGQAYYIDPVGLRMYYLGRPLDAFNLMRSRGLGITNADLALITAASSEIDSIGFSETSEVFKNFSFKYGNISYQLPLSLSVDLYDAYKSSPKVYTYRLGEEPDNLREEFYALFLNIRSGDKTISQLVSSMEEIALRNSWNDDTLAEFALAFVQYIPYDNEKIALSESNQNNNPYYPYETLYLNRGVCSDKTFLSFVLLRELGYGAAILDFPEINHSAIGISCPLVDSINGSGYCYVETTNYFPLSVIPRSVNSGQAETAGNDFENLFDSTNLGKMEIYQGIAGKTYYGAAAVKTRVADLDTMDKYLDLLQEEIKQIDLALKVKDSELKAMKTQMDQYYESGEISAYNNLIVSYNNLVEQYNSILTNYKITTDSYNQKAEEFNRLTREFYQK
ncbi:MAG: hypothetical protein WC146_01860 [Patescibacteria group bacterium]